MTRGCLIKIVITIYSIHLQTTSAIYRIHVLMRQPLMLSEIAGSQPLINEGASYHARRGKNAEAFLTA